MKALPICLLVLVLMLPLPSSSAGDESTYAYHLRVVRVSGPGVDAGAALGWSEDDGEPVLEPHELRGLPRLQEGTGVHGLGPRDDAARPGEDYRIGGGDSSVRVHRR